MKPYKSDWPSPADIPWECSICEHFKVNATQEPCKSCYERPCARRSNWKSKSNTSEKEGNERED
jgi:hypothetical protein